MVESPERVRSNRRLTARHSCQLSVKYGSGTALHPSIAMDVSLKGCRLRVGEDLARGLKLRVRFETPASRGRVLEVEVPGVVIWSRREGLSHQAGVHFTETPPGLAEVLGALA